jgi:hypothetical protein
MVFFLGVNGGKETTFCTLVSENADLNGGLALALGTAFGARISGPAPGFGGSLTLLPSSKTSLESEPDEVKTTAMSF